MRREQLPQFNLLGATLLLFSLIAPMSAANKKAQPQTAQDNKPRTESNVKDARSFFTPQEQQLVIQGLGNPMAQLLIMRELDRRWPLLPRQRVELQALNREISAKLFELRAKRGRQERALEDAIYGAAFEPATIEALSEESAATQIELMKFQGQSEIRLMQILARGNPRRARTARSFIELLVRQGQNRPAMQLLLTRPNGGPMRLLADFFGDDWEMAIPGFGNPASFLLILNQLELTPEQKAAFKDLSQSVRKEMQSEFAERKNQPNNQAQRPDAADVDETATEIPETLPRIAAAEQIIAANAERQARQMKRQTRIEMRVRQILQPKQWDTYVTLLRGLALSGNNWVLPNGANKKMLQQRPAPPRQQPVRPEAD
jgi:Spy/CpxP family protein refolding chaperone